MSSQKFLNQEIEILVTTVMNITACSNLTQEQRNWIKQIEQPAWLLRRSTRPSWKVNKIIAATLKVRK